MSKIKKILLVCTGNSCRSVMAEGFLKKMLEDNGGYEIKSAGIAAMWGMGPTSEAVQVMSSEGIDISAHKTTPISVEMIQSADLILVMENIHKQSILRYSPEVKDKVYLLSEFGRMEGEDKLVDPNIPDPIGRPLDFYHKVFGIIKESLSRVVKQILEEK